MFYGNKHILCSDSSLVDKPTVLYARNFNGEELFKALTHNPTVEELYFTVTNENVFFSPPHPLKIFGISLLGDAELSSEMEDLVCQIKDCGTEVIVEKGRLTYEKRVQSRYFCHIKDCNLYSPRLLFINNLDLMQDIAKSFNRLKLNVAIYNKWLYTDLLFRACQYLRKKDAIEFVNCQFAEQTICLRGIRVGELRFGTFKGLPCNVDVCNSEIGKFTFLSNMKMVGYSELIAQTTINDIAFIEHSHTRLDLQIDLPHVLKKSTFLCTSSNGFARFMPEMQGRWKYVSEVHGGLLPAHLRQWVSRVRNSLVYRFYCGDPTALIEIEQTVIEIQEAQRDARESGCKLLHELSQSVHISGLESSMQNDLSKLIAQSLDSRIDYHEFLRINGIGHKHSFILNKYCQESEQYSRSLKAIVFRATKFDAETMKTFIQRLREELDEGRGMCHLGRINRLVNSLIGLAPELTVRISPAEDIGNKIILRRRQNPGASSDELREMLRVELLEAGYTEEQFSVWLDAV